MRDLFLGFKLLKYGYKLKSNIVMLILFTTIGLVMEFFSRGTNMLGGFYFLLIGMFVYQLIISMDVSEFVQSSAMKRKLQIAMPAFASTAVYIILFTVLVVERSVLLHLYPENADLLIDSLFLIIVILFGAIIFCGVCYKYFWVSIIVFMAAVMFGVSSLNSWLMAHHIRDIVELSIGGMAIFGYVVILLGGIIDYMLGTLLYKKQLSSFAFNGLSRSKK